MSEGGSSHPALRIVIKTVLNIFVVWAMATYLSQYFQLAGTAPASYIIVGALITLMNIFVRPFLAIITMPLRLFATIIAIIIVNGVFVYLVHIITMRMDPELVQLEVFGGPWGWVVVAACFGISNWIVRTLFR